MPRARQSEKSRQEKKSSAPAPDRAVELLRELRALPVGTLAAARALIFAKRDEGVDCPCCGQFAKIYKRPINSAMAYALILIDRYFSKPGHDDWLHVPQFLAVQRLPASELASIRGDWAKLKHWGLLEEMQALRDDGSNRIGYWKITEKGKAFVRGQIAVPRYAHLFDNQLLSLEGPEVFIQDSLGTRFSYNDLMSR